MSSWPDTEATMRAFLRADPAVAAVVDGRVFFGVPERGAVYPLITVQRIGGGVLSGEAPVDSALLQFSCWGASKSSAAEAMKALVITLQSIRKVESDGTRIYEASVDTVNWAPDDQNSPRYTVTALVTAIAV